MPLTSSGKLSRVALGEIAAGLSEEQQVEYSLEDKVKQLPSTEMEKMLQLLWSDVLGISPDLIGANDSFFRLGGDSVVAMRLVAAARASNVLISVANIFQNPELCNMALVVESPKAIAAATANLGPFSLLEDSSLAEIIEQSSSQCKIEKELIEDIYPCTPLQEGLMAISTRQQGAYVARMVFKLPPTLNLDRFRDAWREIVVLEPILRTRIVHTNAGSLQVVLRNEEPWQMGLTLEAYVEKYSKAPIEYGGLLHRLAIIEEIQGASYFVWMVHHALYEYVHFRFSLDILLLLKQDFEFSFFSWSSNTNSENFSGWSQDLLFERVKLLYMGESVPKTPSYNQFIQFLANTDQDASDAFWRSQLLREEAPTSFPLLPSPSYKPRPDQVQTLSIELSRQKVSTITSATIMKAAWAMVVSRYSNSDNIIFALTLSGRTAPVAGIMEMTGPTITTVPLRIQLPRDQTTVYEYLEAIQNQSTEMMPYEHAGLQNLRRLCLGADTKYELDLKHLFVFQPSSEDDDTFLDLELMPTDEADFNTYALVIQCSYENGKVTIEARYDGMVIEKEQMRRMLFQFEHVIRQLNDESRSIRVDDVELFSPQDLQQLQIWNNQKHESMDICIHEVIQKQVLSRPIDALAVCSWDGELTYRELDSLSSRLASYLIDLGVGPEIMVPICFDKSAWTIVAMIAVLKAGGAYVSLSPAHPLTRLRGIVDDIDASMILVAPQHAALFESVLPTIVVVDPSWLNTLPAAITTASSRGPPDSPAFVVFTSGSTGKPKGVVLEHRSMVTMAHAEGPTMQFDSNTRVLHFAASTFDVSNSEVLTTLMFGGCVCVPSEAERMNDLVGVINRWKVNWLFLTPAMADIMDPSAVPTLKTLALGGEAIRQDLLERWADKVHLINSYGPSETTIWTSNSHLRSETTPANIGRGYGAHTWVTEISNHNRLAPIGCIGELLVEGPILARGYIKDPERTAISFIVDPIWARNSQAGPRRIYKTGDLVRYNSDGTLDYIGRKDTQVKLRGQRIELGEIEYHIKQSFLDAQQVVADVILQEGRADDKILAAFLELGPADIDMDDDSDSVLEPMSQQLQSKMLQLQLSLMESLPPYMIPSLFIILKRLPTTTSGKLDRKEMRNLASKLSKAQLAPYSLANVEKRAPSTPMEQKLQGLWSKLLHIESSSIGADDSFFQSGGDSIIAMRLAAVARTENLSITVADIFRYPKLSEMAKAVQNVTFTPAAQLKPFCLLKQEHSSIDIIEWAASLCNVETEAIEDIYPCTPLQEALVDISIRNKGTYIAQNVFRLPEALDLVRFKETWQKLADMHSILRTRVIEMALQVVVREKITWQTASTLDLYLQDDLAMGIELGGPLCRYAIVEGHFIWTAHHAVYDAWSIQSLFEQLENLYNGVDITEPVPYNNFIQHLANVDQEASDAFWEGQLSGDKPTSFPEVHSLVYQPHPDEAYTHTVSISHDPKAGILMSTILQAAWAMTVARYSDSTDVAFAMAVSGRNVHMDGIATVMGPTITTVPVRMRLDPEQVVANYLKGAQNQITEMIPFAHVGLQNIRGLKNAVDLKHLFVIQSSTDEGTTDVLGMKSVPMELMGFDSYGLVVECVQGAGKIDVEVRYDGAIISRDRIQRMLYLFEHLVRQFNDQESHSTALKDISVFSVQDSEQVAAWNIKQPAVSNECMHSLVEAQVSARSYAPAILAWDGNFTYAELDSRSTQLAHHLISVGVKPEVMVPLCYDKSGWAIIAMLAILKAGGACVALNPEHPPERLQRIVNDVKATVIVAQQHHAHLFQGIDADIVSPDKSLLKKYSKTGTFTMAQPENPAFVVFTSGSTGAPKGIILEHRALCTSAHAHGKAMRLGVDSRVLQFAAYTFDVSIGEIFTTLIHGGCICVPSEEERMNDLAAFINRMSVNWAYLTPTVAALLHPADVPTLKTLSLGGEALTKENVAVWADKVYLINIYGPAETSIWSTALCGLKPETPPSNLGYGVGASMWITEVSNHNHLCPIGCVGELLIEGAILARGYVGLEEKTRESFIMNPTWAKGHGDRRFYKTGDLVRYNADGTIDYVSRKDTQFKLHGQRIEASEIEHHLSTDSHVRHSMVLLPKAKSGQQRLTAILSLESIAVPASKGKPQLVQNEAAEMEIFSIRKQLSEKVPGYMVPAIWLVVEDISMTVSGKMNRLEMTKWVEQMDEDVYATAMDIEKLDGSEIPATDMEEKIQKILSHVLNMPIIRLNKSFMSLGGDSITAMQMRTKCRAEGISVSIQDILRSKTISQIALAAKSISESSVSHIEVLDTPFDLSPVQQMYFDIESKNSTSHHFYQSFLLRVTRKIGALQVARAIETVVGQHSMLRARFTQGEDGQWMQRIIGDVADSYRFKMHEFTKRAQAMSLISSSQNSLDIVNGPVFVAELFNINDDDSGDNSYQLLFVRAHHLVIDLVSWRIILHDLEEVLESGRLSVQKPLSFQGWCGMLAEHTKQMVPQETLPIHISPADFDYWGMANQPNIFEDQLETTFSLDREMTNKLFGVSNEALRTEPVDIILAALIYSFNQVFNDRQTPTIFSEGHGRESWDPEIDVAGIVGWFTTMNPLHVPVTNGQGILATLEHTKDLRRKVPSSGFSYFCSRFLSPEGRKAFGDHNQMEVIFNYQGRYQQLERDTALLRPEDLAEMEGPKDQGPDMERFSLFEISVAVVKGETEVCFTYNRHMQHPDLIERWILECKESLKKITAQLATMEVKITLSDFPLLSLDDNELQRFEANLSGLGINPSHVQDAYPTSPMQESMLLAQQRKPGVYEVKNIYDVLPGSEGDIVNISRIGDAWQKVVDRHVSLRTIFVPSVSRKGGFDQIVLDRYCARTEYIECSDGNISKAIHDQQSIDYQEPRPHHRLSIFRSGSKVACKLEISHALSDGISIRLLIRDLGIAYESKAQLHPGPLYHDYISFLQQQSSSQANDYWRSYLRTVKQCHFPHSEGNLSRVKEQRTLRVNLNEDFTQIQAFCKHHGFTVANVFQATWGLVLRHYTGRDDASYGYLTSGRDIPIAGVSDLVGTLIHMLVYRQDITETTMVSELLERTKEDFLQSLPYQYGLIEALGAQAEGSEQLLFNTIMSLQYSGGLGETADAADMPLVRFENTGGQDPNQVCY
jgi:amino acid adenylation domain-containing protein/non-ribosomal peptide synthase protein (TIGR01720 family)